MNIVKTTLIAASAAMVLSSGLAMANGLPKATLEMNSESKTLIGSSAGNTTRDTTWHYGEVNDQVVFSSNISITNSSNDLVYTTIEFKGMKIRDNSFILPGKSVDNITTNFPFKTVHVILRDYFNTVFFDGYISPNSHFTIAPVDTYIVLGARSEGVKSKLKLVRD